MKLLQTSNRAPAGVGPRTPRRARLAALLAASAITAASAGAAAQKLQLPQPADTTPAQTVWPLPPDEPRLRYVAVYDSRKNHEDAKPARASSLREFLLGKDQGRPPAPKKRGLEKPFGVAVDGYGRMLVTDPVVGGVVVIDPQSSRLTTLTEIQGQSRFRIPIGVAVDLENNFYVGDNGLGRILVFGPDLMYRRTIGAEGEMKTPSGLAIDDARRRLYVVDTQRHVLLAYDLGTGRITGRVGRRGEGEGEFNYPTGVAVGPDGLVYVTDTMNCRVEVFDATLKPLRSFGSEGIAPGKFRRPKGIAVDAENVVYVVDSDFNNFQLFTSAGEPLMFVGEIGQRPGQLLLPAGIAIDRLRRRIYVCEQVNARVQVFERIGPPRQ